MLRFSPSEQAVFDTICSYGPMTTKQIISEVVEYTPGTVRRAIQVLCFRGCIREAGSRKSKPRWVSSGVTWNKEAQG